MTARGVLARLAPNLFPLFLLAAGVAIALGGRCHADRAAVREEDRRGVSAQVEAASHDAAAVEARAVEERRTVTRTDERPDGSRSVTVEAVERVERAELASYDAGSTVRAAATESSARVREERPAARWRVAGAAGWDVTRPTLRPSLYRVELARRVAGPVWLGAWAATDRAAGLSLAVEW